MNIRLYEPTDLESLVTMWHETKRTAFYYVPVQQQHTVDDDRDYFQKVILATCEVWIAEIEEEIIGFMALERELIDQLFVRQDWQGHGVGKALLAKAQELSPQRLRLYTFEKNKEARIFYERYGFRAIRFGVSDPPENEPDVEYEWRPSI